ncbi:adenylate cyclase [Acinetobacter baumannii]|uniref:adenylate cyclase n=1 Tax=Acinetobacter baumannii TaxID=470 RepID=UPI001C0B1728|nr:adenylate cyclase [Acinetobacter baumannii]MBU3816207.1 adenylate cyclase [Acinetobacter baumannii]MDC5634822.1 adenylate cyclase [Acinetobacter baumannii]HCA4923669.1 adenylate cyclase [Acinetobacter baumannii]HCV3127208.1 adenylate cyclase [Acinetobacter baumannii]
MSGGQTKNAALTTALAFHYQVLIGLDKCFSLEEGQSVWFEKDGDVSLMSPDTLASTQTEVKDYAAPLTDHHENLWKTLKNWLSPEFNHAQYGVLVLHTTQAFGATTQLKNWNAQTAEQRLAVLRTIFAERTEEQLNAKKPSDIIKLQKSVMMDTTQEDLMTVLAKVVLHVESADLETLKKSYFNKLSGYIPPANRQAFAEGLIGFIYEQASDVEWVIHKTAFDQKREALTAKWGPTLFTIPDFYARDATEDEVDTYIKEFFAQKIIDIEYENVLPEAIGSWLELRNALIEELNGYPQFREVVSQYRERLIKIFSAKHRSACRKQGSSVAISQDLYDEVTSEIPFSIEGYPNPDIIFRNGLIHDVMDDDERDLKWRVEP